MGRDLSDTVWTWKGAGSPFSCFLLPRFCYPHSPPTTSTLRSLQLVLQPWPLGGAGLGVIKGWKQAIPGPVSLPGQSRHALVPAISFSD